MSADILRALAGMLSNPVDFEILRLRNLKQKNIPVWVVNLSSSRKKLSKGTEIAVCEPVACITPMLVRANKGKQVASKVDSIPEHLHDLYEKSVDGLNKNNLLEVKSRRY